MGRRKRIGLFFSYNEDWIGGSYYMLNLIEALKLLPPDEQPHVTIFYTEDKDVRSVQVLNYPGIEFERVKNVVHPIQKALNFLSRKVSRKRIFISRLHKKIPKNYFDALFPMPLYFDSSISKRLIYWIPDFQDVHLPQFFSDRGLAWRSFSRSYIANSNESVIFSSCDAQKDFNVLQPDSKVKQYVVPFAVTHPVYDTIDIEQLRTKYKLPPAYFFCPNQFWIHKNQLVILEAIKKIKDVFKEDIKVVFSGKEYDRRTGQSYFDELKKYVKKKGIENNVLFLGFIDREDQLAIMKNAVAVIQPSLFEGWSTVIEDAKSMNQNIIASNLNVNMEQLGDKAVFFDPRNSDSLANAIKDFKKTPVQFNYDISRLKFARDFLNVLNTL